MKLSVAMCTYNGEQYIKKQMESILKQSMVPNEIVICDDGSNDKTIEIIEEFQKNYPNKISLYQNQINLGSNKNFEKAISICTGDYIFLSDQDDIWKKNKVEKTIAYFNDNKSIDCIFSNADLINDENENFTKKSLWDCFLFVEKDLPKPINLYSFIISINNVVTGATICFKKEIKNLILPIPVIPEFYHDQWIAVKMASQNKLGYITDELISYRIHDEQQTGIGENVTKDVHKKHQYLYKYIVSDTSPNSYQDIKKLKKIYFKNYLKFKEIAEKTDKKYRVFFKKSAEHNYKMYKKQNDILKKTNPIRYFFEQLKYKLKGKQF